MRCVRSNGFLTPRSAWRSPERPADRRVARSDPSPSRRAMGSAAIGRDRIGPDRVRRPTGDRATAGSAPGPTLRGVRTRPGRPSPPTRPGCSTPGRRARSWIPKHRRQPVDLGVQPLGDLRVAEPEPGVEQQHAVRVPHRVAHHQAGAAGEVALGGVGEVGEMEGLDLDVRPRRTGSHGRMVGEGPTSRAMLRSRAAEPLPEDGGTIVPGRIAGPPRRRAHCRARQLTSQAAGPV